MARVDPDDDEIDRWVLFHYRFDVTRHQRRNVVVAAFDDRAEMVEMADAMATALNERKQRGEADTRERISGVLKHAGYVAEQNARRAGPRGRRGERVRKRGSEGR